MPFVRYYFGGHPGGEQPSDAFWRSDGNNKFRSFLKGVILGAMSFPGYDLWGEDDGDGAIAGHVAKFWLQHGIEGEKSAYVWLKIGGDPVWAASDSLEGGQYGSAVGIPH